MGKVSKDIVDLDEAIQEEQESSLPAPTSGNKPLVIGQVSGDDDADDLTIPVLKITHGVGKLGKAGYTPGDLVIDGKHLVVGREQPLTVLVLGCDKYWKEVVPYNPNNFQQATIFANKKEAEAAGLRTKWEDDPNNPGERIAPDVRPAATMVLLLEKPEDLVSGIFTIKLEAEPDKLYTLVRFYVDKAAYDRTAKHVIAAGSSHLSAAPYPLFSAKWTLQTFSRELGGNSTIVPEMTQGNLTTPDLVQELVDRFSNLSL